MDAELPWPESVAAANIVKAGGESSEAPKYIFSAMAFAGVLQVLKSDKGFQILREFSEGFIKFPRAVVNHFNFEKQPIGSVVQGGGIPWATPNLSPALIGIGYIIGPHYAFVTAAGGVIAWWVLIPLLLFFDPDLPTRMTAAPGVTNDVLGYTLWFNIVRPIAVGMMLVGTANTLFSMRSSLADSLRGALQLHSRGDDRRSCCGRSGIFPCAGSSSQRSVLLVPITWLYYVFHRQLVSRRSCRHCDDPHWLHSVGGGRLPCWLGREHRISRSPD